MDFGDYGSGVSILSRRRLDTHPVAFIAPIFIISCGHAKPNCVIEREVQHWLSRWRPSWHTRNASGRHIKGSPHRECCLWKGSESIIRFTSHIDHFPLHSPKYLRPTTLDHLSYTVTTVTHIHTQCTGAQTTSGHPQCPIRHLLRRSPLWANNHNIMPFPRQSPMRAGSYH